MSSTVSAVDVSAVHQDAEVAVMLRQQLAAAQDREVKLKQQLLAAAAKSSDIPNNEQELASMRQELDSLRVALDASLDSNAIQSTELLCAQNRSIELEQEILTLRNELSSLHHANTNRISAPGGPSASASELSCVPATSSPSTSPSNNKSMNDDSEMSQYAETLESVKASYQKTITEMTETFQTNLSAAQSAYTNASTQMSNQFQLMGKQMQEQAQQLNDTKQQLLLLQGQHALCTFNAQNLSHTNNALNASIIALQSQLMIVDAAKKKLELSLHTLLADHGQSHLSESITAELEQIRLSQSDSSLSGVNEGELSSLRAELVQKNSLLDSLRASQVTDQPIHSYVADHQEKLQAASLRAHLLEEQLTESRMRTEELQRQCTEQTNAAKQSTAELIEVQSQLSDVQSQLAVAQSHLSQREEHHASQQMACQAQMERFQSQSIDAQNQLHQQEREVTTLHTQITKLQEQVESKQQRIDRRQLGARDGNSELALLQTENDNLRSALDASLDSNAIQSTELLCAQNRSIELEQEILTLRNELSSLHHANTNRISAPGGPSASASELSCVPATSSPSTSPSNNKSMNDDSEMSQYAETLESVKASYQKTITEMTETFQTNLSAAQSAYTNASTQMSNQFQLMGKQMQEQAQQLNDTKQQLLLLQGQHALCTFNAQNLSHTNNALNASIIALQSQLMMLQSISKNS
jgi:chromosome segregation ATPase